MFLKQKNIFLIIAVLPALIFYLFFLKYGINAPYADDLGAINSMVIRFYHGGDSFFEKIILLFAQCNGHREFYLATVSVIQYAIFGEINFLVLDFIGGLASLGILFIFYRIIKKYNLASWLIIPISFILFNLTYYHNIFWAVCALQHNSLPFFVLLNIYVLDGKQSLKRFSFSIILAILAVFTSANGFLLFIAAFPLLIKYPKKYWLFWILTGVICFVFYMWNYVHPIQRASLSINFFEFEKILKTFFIYLGAFSSAFFYTQSENRIAINLILGIFSFILILVLFWKNKNKLLEENNPYIILSSIFLFLFATMGLYSLARANEPIESIFESRYAINQTIYLISLLLLIVLNFQIGKITKGFIFAFSILFFISSYFSKVLAVVGFTNELTAITLSGKNLKRGYYFYSDSSGKKVDLTAPSLQNLEELPYPIVDITAISPSSLKYLNDVLYLSFSYPGLYPFNKRLEQINQSIVRNQPHNLKKKEPLALLYFKTEKNGFRYSGKTVKARVSNGEDGVYAVFVNNENKNFVFNLYWSELNRHQQMLNWDAIYVRNLEGIIPFKYLPDGKYQLKVFKVEGDSIQMIGSHGNMIVKGM